MLLYSIALTITNPFLKGIDGLQGAKGEKGEPGAPGPQVNE